MKPLIILLSMIVLTGCGDYVPRETFALKTVDGSVIELTCPVVDSRRSAFTYHIDSHCVVEPRIVTVEDLKK